MDHFSDKIAQDWNISTSCAAHLCTAYTDGDSVLYLSEYHPDVNTELDYAGTYSVYAFLDRMAALGPKRKRLKNALKKSQLLTAEVERAIDEVTNSCELDDMIAQFRVNPRSKAQKARDKGLGDLADKLLNQELEQEPEEDAAALVDSSNSALASADMILEGVRDIIVDAIARNETVRTLAREFTLDDGYIEVQPKKKYESEFKSYIENQVRLDEIPTHELLNLLSKEGEGAIKLKISVNLFSIVELLKEHLIEDPESYGTHIMIEAIEECWNKNLHSLVEKQIKEILKIDHEKDLLEEIAKELEEIAGQHDSTQRIVAIFQQDNNAIALTALDRQGNFLGASTINRTDKNSSLKSRLSQFYNRHRPSTFLITASGETLKEITSIAEQISAQDVEITETKVSRQSLSKIAESNWMNTRYGDLETPMRKAFASGITHCRPIPVMQQIGIEFFPLHPLQNMVASDHIYGLVDNKARALILKDGLDTRKCSVQSLLWLPCIQEEAAEKIHAAITDHGLSSKAEMASLEGISHVMYRNIAGWLLFPDSDNPLDYTRVHPDNFSWVEEICAQMDITTTALINTPEALSSYEASNYLEESYVQNALIPHLRTGKNFLLKDAARRSRRKTLSELSEGTVVTGVVTNITKFGVFVDINAEYDGLIHISQLADQYVEVPEQVVSVRDIINVRIVKIQPEKKRISLSMKDMGNLAPKVKASKGQLDTLAQHFKTR